MQESEGVGMRSENIKTILSFALSSSLVLSLLLWPELVGWAVLSFGLFSVFVLFTCILHIFLWEGN